MSAACKVIPYGRQFIDDDDIEAVTAALRGDWLTQGPTVRRFEEELASACGAKHAVAVSNGTVALQLACLAADLKEGDEALTSPITFLASATAAVACGARPRFADIDPKDWTISPSAAAAAINERTKVIIPVDFAGLPCDLENLRALADASQLTIISDACHSIGATYHGHPVGGTGLAHMTCFSFHPVKTITTGEGGAVLTDDVALAEKLRLLRHHGMTKDPAALSRRDEGPWYYELHQPALNGRLTDFQCALGLSQLKKLERFVARRQMIARRYRDALDNIPGVSLQAEPEGRSNAHHLFVIHVDGRHDRRALFEALAREGIHCQVHYHPVHLQPYFMQTFGTGVGDCPAAEAYAAGCLSLPIYPALEDDDQQRVIDRLQALLA